MYHRILPQVDMRYQNEEPGMIVTPDSFRQHLKIIKEHFAVLPLREWVERQSNGKTLPERTCAITFDDGWRDNFEFALPILEQEQTPATIFAVSDMIGTTQQFWPNRLAGLLTDPELSEHPTYRWLKEIPGYTSGKSLDRENIAAIIDNCKRFSDPELEQYLESMEAAAGKAVTAKPALMSWDQIRQMQNTGLVDIGSHTCRHRRLLEGLPSDVLRREIVDSGNRIAEELGRPVKLFCYPNGDASNAAKELVSRHYLAAVTTQHGINDTTKAAHSLLRIGMHEDIANTEVKFRARLSGWV